MRQIKDHLWPAAVLVVAVISWAYGVVSDAGKIAALILSPMQWQLVGGGLLLVSLISILAQWHGAKAATPAIEAAKAPTPAPATAPAAAVVQSVTSQNQTGGFTAHTINVGHPPRTLAKPGAQNLKDCLLTKAPKAGPWKVMATMGDTEAFALAGEIHQFMRENGFTMKEPEASQGVFRHPCATL
jgi:hypothetical protein